MGGFATMSGTAGVTQTSLEAALRSAAKNVGRSPIRVSKKLTSSDHFMITPGEPGRLSILFPAGYDKSEELVAFLSKKLEVPVFLFHIHDGDLWMYCLYAGGIEIDRFNPIPDYWGRVSPKEKAEWAGDARVISRCWPDLEPTAIKKYLVFWDEESGEPEKAYADDRYPYGDCRQLADFMRSLGLRSPFEDEEPVSSNLTAQQSPAAKTKKMTKSTQTKDWDGAWADARSLKTAAARREALEVVRQAPLAVVLRLARAKRKLISRTFTLPNQHGSSVKFFFAGGRRKNVLTDVVQIDVLYWRGKLRAEQILICHEVIVARVPGGYYDIRESVLAAAGHEGGSHIVNMNAFQFSSNPPKFQNDFERDMPRLQRYHSRRCLWSIRGFGLPKWRARLQSEKERELERAYCELEEALGSVRMENHVGREVFMALEPYLISRLSHSNPQIQLSANRVWNWLKLYRAQE